MPTQNWKTLGVPIGIYTARNDTSTTRPQAHALAEAIGNDTLIVYHELEGGHSTYLIPRNLTFFLNETLPFIEKYANV